MTAYYFDWFKFMMDPLPLNHGLVGGVREHPGWFAFVQRARREGFVPSFHLWIMEPMRDSLFNENPLYLRMKGVGPRGLPLRLRRERTRIPGVSVVTYDGGRSIVQPLHYREDPE